MAPFATLRALPSRLQWRKGLRAALAVALAILVSQALGQPYGWAALGAFEAILVDNGGPYRSRLITILTVLLGGAVAGILGALVAALLLPEPTVTGELLAMLATAAVCFAFTFARVLTQPLASTSVIILVLYFAGLGSGQHTFAGIAPNVVSFIAGGLGAAAISLVLWPLDPFRPARRTVAAIYTLLAQVTARIADDHQPEAHDWKRHIRTLIETARAALGQTAARAPSRTIRARNLTVLLETADMLFARAIRLTEFAHLTESSPFAIKRTAQWLAQAEQAIGQALDNPPTDNAASFTAQGSHTLQLRRSSPSAHISTDHALTLHLQREGQEALQELEAAFEAVQAIWTGATHPAASPPSGLPTVEPAVPPVRPIAALLESARADWSLQSPMLRHALRMAAVGAVDVLFMRLLHVSHGFWLAMTSIIVLQPFGSGTMRRGLQRVAGTIAGGLFAALLTSLVHTQTGILLVVTACSGLCLAAFAIDYGLYSFFLTPTFVLLSLPHLQDWRYAGVRILTTVLGALVAVLAMRLLWPQPEHRELARLLEAGIQADAAYLRAILGLWSNPIPEHRALLAQARRTCGLTSNAAEEALDRLLLEPSFTRKSSPETEHALAITTYLRRITQTITTLAGLTQTPPASRYASIRIDSLALRLEALTQSTAETPANPVPNPEHPLDDLTELQIRRIERQISVLERASRAMLKPIV